MQARVEATTAEIGEFVEQDEHQVLVLDGSDDDVVYALEILGGLDRSDDGNLYLNFGHPCLQLRTWMDELVARLGAMIEGGNAMRTQEGQQPWPSLPQQATDGRVSPWMRMRALIEFIDGLVLLDDPTLAGSETRPGGVVVLWSLVPMHIDDIAGYKGLLAHLIVGERPTCRLRHRFVVRDDRNAPFLVPELDAARTPGVAIIALDFSPARLNEDLNKAVADPAVPDEQRILAMFQLAAVDFAEQRYQPATEKYAVVYDFYEGKNQPGMQGLCLAGVGDVALRQGDAPTALARYQQALALVCPTKKLPLMLNPMLGAGEASYQCGRFDDAAGYFAHAADIARAQLNPNVVSDARAKQGIALREAGRQAEAIAAWQSGTVMAETVNYAEGRQQNLELMAALYEQVGMENEAAICRARIRSPMPAPATEVQNAHLIPGHPDHPRGGT